MSPKSHGITFRARDLEHGRKYLWRKEFVPLLLGYLDVKPGQSIVDVGCGTGHFTRLVARGLRGEGKVVGVDNDRRLLTAARKISREEGLEDIVSFRYGDANALTLRSNSADRVLCQMTLWTFREPKEPLGEMIRVCKPGGLVGAVEGAWDYVIFYDPANPRLAELWRKWNSAFVAGSRRVYGSDRGVGYKLPVIFRELGLKRVRLDGLPYIYTESDDRVPTAYKVRGHKMSLESRGWGSGVERKGGMSEVDSKELGKLNRTYLRRLIEHPSLIQSDFSMNAGINFITTGIKPSSHQR